MLYIAILLLMFACVYAFDLRGHRRMYTLSYWAFFVILVLVVGLRYRIGTDSIAYENGYMDYPAIWELEKFKFNSIRFEPGFLFFASIPRSISSDFILFQFFHAIVVNLVIFHFIWKNTTHRFLCLVFYFIILYFNLNTQVLRESLAVCCILLAWPYFRDNKWLQYYLLVLLGCTFHTSATLFLFMPLFCLPFIREAFVIGKRTILICIVLLIVGTVIQAQFSTFFSMLALNDRMMDRVNAYSNSEYGTGKLNVFGTIYTFSRYSLYPFVALYFLQLGNRIRLRKSGESKKIRKREAREFDRWEMMTVMSIYFIMLSIPIFVLGRYFNYFGMFALATVATWMFSRVKVKGKTYRLNFQYWVLILVPYIAINLIGYTTPTNRSSTLKEYMIFYPYTSRLNPERDQNREAIYRYYNVR